jgi:nicotinamide-nucleotide amidase
MADAPEYQIGKYLRDRNWKLATAESCTGGLIGHRITNVAGSSEYYLGGAVAYAYEAKEQILGVRHETLLEFGAVSLETVMEMACGARNLLGAEVAISVSGIAGPGGGLPNKPVGTVWIGLCSPDGGWAKVFHFSGDREEVKAASAEEALRALFHYLVEGKPWADVQQAI